MHVVQLFDPLLRRPHIKIVKPPLPEMFRALIRHARPKSQLIPIPTPPFSPNRSRHPLLEHVHHRPGRANPRLGDQNVNVFGHDDVTDQRELIFLPHPAQNLEQQLALASIPQKGKSSIAATGDEMQMPLVITPFEFVAQDDEVYAAHPLPKPQRVRHPQKKIKDRSTAKSTTVVVSSSRIERQATGRFCRSLFGCRTLRFLKGADFDLRLGHPPPGETIYFAPPGMMKAGSMFENVQTETSDLTVSEEVFAY
jgi:hypothetical protein